MRRKDEDKKARSIWDVLGKEQKRTVGVNEGEQERGWNPSGDHTPMEKVAKYSVLTPASSDEHTHS